MVYIATESKYLNLLFLFARSREFWSILNSKEKFSTSCCVFFVLRVSKYDDPFFSFYKRKNIISKKEQDIKNKFGIIFWSILYCWNQNQFLTWIWLNKSRNSRKEMRFLSKFSKFLKSKASGTTSSGSCLSSVGSMSINPS